MSVDFKHSDITGKIIGCAMEVHKRIGCGFQEIIYSRALNHEMHLQGLKFVRELDMPIYYRDERVGMRRVDFFVENVVMVEIKAVSHLEDLHLAQGLNYLEAYRMEVGLLINFGSKSLEFKRLMKTHKLKS